MQTAWTERNEVNPPPVEYSGRSPASPPNPSKGPTNVCSYPLFSRVSPTWQAEILHNVWELELIASLDVSLLQDEVLAPVFGIDDPRTSKRIAFVGGIRGTGELEQLVAAGGFACAFSMFPTGIADLMAIADAGGIMPPKSTWFEPKLRDAMFCHLI